MATCRCGWSIIMKSMNCGTPASVALPDRSSRGMIRSTSTVTVAYSCAVKNFGLNGVARFAACARAASACSRACCASAGVQTSAAANGADVTMRSAARRVIGAIRAFLDCAAARCARTCASPARGSSRCNSCARCETNGPPSATNRFFTSCAWQFAFSTDVCGSFPIRVVPTSWMMRPTGSRP